jgi:hypothetical protein
MKKPNKNNEQKTANQKQQKPVVSKNKKQPTKQNQKSLAPKVVESKEDVKKSMIQKIEEKMSVKKKDVNLDLSNVVDKVLIVFIVLQVAGLIYLLVK